MRLVRPLAERDSTKSPLAGSERDRMDESCVKANAAWQLEYITSPPKRFSQLAALPPFD